MPNTFRHPPPKARTATIRVKRSFFGACRTEVVKLAGVSLSGQASEVRNEESNQKRMKT